MLLLLATLLARPAVAQETVDIGVVKESDLSVVQKLLYPKAGRSELAIDLGWMPFDAFLTTPNLQMSYTSHSTEWLGIGFALGGGYGLKNGNYHTLAGPNYGVAPDAYRYLGSALAGVEWSPIYAKASLTGARIVHYDIVVTGRAGVTVEQSVIPRGGFAIGPTLSAGLGSRIFLGETSALRLEVRDDMMTERRKLTQTTYFKQNVDVMVGYSILSKPKGKK